MKVSKEAQQEQRKLWYEREKESLAKLKAAGVEINDIPDRTAFRNAVKPVWEKHGAANKALIDRIQAVN
jgi:TRAP-type C4-dicarboxylate transport system substrate-binding protein